MLEQYYPFLLALLEMTFLFVALGILHSQRRSIGMAPFYLSTGLLLLFAQLIGAVGLEAELFDTLRFPVVHLALVLPLLGAMLVVYATEGTLAAQRFIIGSLVSFGLFLYLGEITRLQSSWQGFFIAAELPGEALDYVLRESRRSMVVMELALLLDLFLLPIIFTRLRNTGCRLWFCVMVSLLATQLTDIGFYWLFFRDIRPDTEVLLGTMLARVLGAIWLGILLTTYLDKIEREVIGGRKRPLDIVFAFLGGYGRTHALEQNLREWEGRYRLLLENASEFIVLLTPDGRIIDANPAATRLLTGEENSEKVLGTLLYSRLSLPGGAPFRPEDRRDEAAVLTLDAKTTERARQLSFSIAEVETHGQRLFTLIGRDVTEELKLAEEKQRLSEDLAHSQRLEALGQLAGGIAHDFNNHLHAILGHLDVIEYVCDVDDPKVSGHLQKIGRIAEQCGKLTAQLLGYARKGKYQVADLDLRKVLESSCDLLLAGSRGEVKFFLELPAEELPVRGDLVQLQQVFLNLMLNAIDALSGSSASSRELHIGAAEASACPFEVFDPAKPQEKVPREKYVYAWVRDNGGGIDPATLSKIFEPFFTTKPIGKGTGMGLSMVYGTVTHHFGWVQVESELGIGSEFRIFLPKRENTADA